MPAVVESSSIHHVLIIILYLSASTFLPVRINTVFLPSTVIFPLRMAARPTAAEPSTLAVPSSA